MKCKFIASRRDKKWPGEVGNRMARRGRRFRNAATEGGEARNRPRKGEKERVNARILIMATKPGCGLAGVLFLATCFVRFREALRLRANGWNSSTSGIVPSTDEFHFTRRESALRYFVYCLTMTERRKTIRRCRRIFSKTDLIRRLSMF